ncbi:hypothetical protein M1D55_11280 [Cupriavidus sp. JZ107]
MAGQNGCGKSTLPKVMAGHLAPLAGACSAAPETAYLISGWPMCIASSRYWSS